jgi:ribosome-binding protein aMBF1 (putative translation factor)
MTKQHHLIKALLADRKRRGESRNAQATRLGIRESSLRSAETARRLHRGTVMVLEQALNVKAGS